MKISLLQPHWIKLTTECPDDVFTLGRLSVKLKARVNQGDRPDTREMECGTKDLINLAAE